MSKIGHFLHFVYVSFKFAIQYYCQTKKLKNESNFEINHYAVCLCITKFRKHRRIHLLQQTTYSGRYTRHYL